MRAAVEPRVTEGAAVLTRTYEQQDRVKSYTNAAGETIGYRYDANGNLTVLTYPDGKTVTYGYDEYDRVVTITDWAGRLTQFSWDYVGRLEKINRANGTWRKMVYDAGDRLTKAEEHLANGRLVTVQQYGFDGASRITNKFTAPKMHPASFTTFSGTYDADNRLNGFAADTDGNLLAMPGVPEGNAASAPGALGATWDARNRLTTLTGAAGWRPAFSASYAYDSEGNRISKTVGVGGVNSTTAWTVNPHGPGGLSQVLVETVNGGAKKFFVHGPTGLLYDVDTAATPNVRHFHTDQVGSTVALTNQLGAVIGRAEYSAYGMVSYREGDTATPFLYNGAYGVMTDAESGLLNMRARYYHPWIGRFASPDPIGFSGGMNWFAYADGDPISAMDPFGLRTVEEMMGDKLWGANGPPGPPTPPLSIRLKDALYNSFILMPFGGNGAVASSSPYARSGGYPQSAVQNEALFQQGQNAVVDAFGTAALANNPQTKANVVQSPTTGGRLGNQTTRQQVSNIATEMESRGWAIEWGGGRFAEEYLPGPGGARKGSSFPDITATKAGRTLRVNTVDTYADGVTPSNREAINAARIRAQTGEHLLLVPKSWKP